MRNLDNPIEFARHRRRSATSGEFLMWQIVRDRQRCKMKFRREHPLGPYTCDFYCAEVKLDLECDGKDHFTDAGKARDARRDAWMERQGITTLRFTNQQIENDTQTVIKIIEAKLRELASPSPPAPLPEDGERGASSLEGSIRDNNLRDARPPQGSVVDNDVSGARSIEGSIQVNDLRDVWSLEGPVDDDDLKDARSLEGSVRQDDASGSDVMGTSSCANTVHEGGSNGVREIDARSTLSPPLPVFGERGSGGEGQSDRTLKPVSVRTNQVNSNTDTRSKPNLNAFTLIELLVTLVIVSVLAAATLPAFKNVIVERKTSVAALEVKAFMDAARARAIARGRPVSVILERLSSRWDGTFAGGLAQSSTANNSPSGVEDNFDVYNTCIRMVMAETLRSTEFEIPVNVIGEDLATGSTQIGNDNDGVLEPCRILSFSNSDNRLSAEVSIGSEIELVDQNEKSHFFRIKNFTISSGNYIVVIDNDGNSTRPFGTIAEIRTSAENQSMIQAFTSLATPMAKFRTRSVPRPVASMVTELPKGACIDLSLSGLASEDPNVNITGNLYRDCRREFASDWVLPPTLGGLPPLPSQLRPIYLTFSPTGKLTSVLCNTPQTVAPTAGDPTTYLSTLRRIEPQSDVCLFVGRNDQVIPAADTAGLAAALDTSLKPNLTDPTGYWVRISPSSGIISAAPAQASHIIEDIEDFRANSTLNEPISHLLEDSRSLVFGAELTSQ